MVAEGIETVAERDVVLATGITLAQGFLLGRPAPLDQLAATVTPRVAVEAAANHLEGEAGQPT